MLICAYPHPTKKKNMMKILVSRKNDNPRTKAPNMMKINAVRV